MWPQSWAQGPSMPSIVDSGTLNHASFDTHLLSMRGRYPHNLGTSTGRTYLQRSDDG